jgi:Asp-tRNA(Asn)/Glu-tRNA(Gln) amidotransferase A subunit family amidase
MARTRSVADVALVLSAIAGPDERDGGVAPVDLCSPGGLRDLRVALLEDDGLARPDADTLRVLSAAADALADAGAVVEPAAPIGLQIAAHPWRDDMALAVALALEGALGGYCAP